MSRSFPDEALYTLLCKYLLDEADMAERELVEDWRLQDTDNEALLASLQRVLQASVATPPMAVQADTEVSWQQLLERAGVTPVMNRQPETTAPDTPIIPVNTPRRRFNWLQAAAILLLIAGAAWWWLFASPGPPARTFNGPQLATLDDGSRIEMTGTSRLETEKGFGKKNRRVYFSGNATFDVARDAAHPFIVQMGSMEVKVLGTRFHISDAQGKALLAIHVSDGKIMVIDHAHADSVIMTAGMLLKKTAATAPFSVAAHVADPVKKSLVFKDTPLEAVLQTVRTVYNVQVDITDTSLLHLPVTTTFTNEPVENIMATVSFITNASLEKIDEGHYRLK